MRCQCRQTVLTQQSGLAVSALPPLWQSAQPIEAGLMCRAARQAAPSVTQ